MKLNMGIDGEEAEYYLSYLPRIKQQTFTVGAAYNHYIGKHVLSLIVGYNYLRNQNLKYRGNDDSEPENLTLDLNSTEQKFSIRVENRTYADRWTFTEGAETYYAHYHNRVFQLLYGDEQMFSGGEFMDRLFISRKIIGGRRLSGYVWTHVIIRPRCLVFGKIYRRMFPLHIVSCPIGR